MNYLEILENLGVSVTNEEREVKFCANIFDVLSAYDNDALSVGTAISICRRIGITIASLGVSLKYPIRAGDFLRDILFQKNYRNERIPLEIKELLTCLSIILTEEHFIENNTLKVWVEEALEAWKLPYVLCDGIIIPKGVKEFDKALVCDVAMWLKKYPATQKPYLNALQQYYDNAEPRDIADNLRKSLEAFLQEFLGNKKNLDKNISVVGTYLKENGINEEVRKMFTTLISHYKSLNDKTAKHHDDTDKNSVEFLLYQTGVFMRYLLKINESKKEETEDE